MKKFASIPALILFSVAVLLTSCEKALLGGDPADSPQEVFDHLWTDLHHRYSYFELKNIDWEAVKAQYTPRIREDMSELELFEVLADLLFELRDGHVNLTSSFNRSRNWEWSQSFPLNYNQGIIDRNYLGTEFWITGPLRHHIIDSVLYINCRSFGGELARADADAVAERAAGLAGVIIDVRSNGGGNLGNALRLASAFTETSYTYGRVRIKDGTCTDCFSSWTDLRVNTRNGPVYTGEVVVLTNRESYSTTTYFAEMMRVNPRAVLMGDQTGGGGGTPAFGELPNGWTYRFSSTQAVDNNGRHFEQGIPVDEEVELEKTDEDNGIDTVIERALKLLRE